MSITSVETAVGLVLDLMEATFNPFSGLTNVYGSHTVAALWLDAITVEPINVKIVSVGRSNDDLADPMIEISIRIHTAYSGMPKDITRNVEMIDQIIEALKTHINLATNDYRIVQVEVTALDEEFTESATLGAQVNIVVQTLQRYTQA